MIPLRTGLIRIMTSATGSARCRRPRPGRRTTPRRTTGARGRRPGCRPVGRGAALPSQHADGGGPGSAEPRCPPPCSQRIRHVEDRRSRPPPAGGEPPRAATRAVRTGRRDGSRRTGGAGSTLAARGGHRRAGRSGRGRPLPRRAAMIARPARVRIRRRKPCFLCRRRLFGWNVRLLTGMTPVTRDHRMSTNPLIGSVQGACPAHRRRNPQGAQHETAGSTPTDPRYVAACGQVKPAIPRLFHSLVDRIVRNGKTKASSPSGLNRH
jgi:hypothetical protein